MAVAAFRLTSPTVAPNVCSVCEKVCRDMSRHTGSTACSNEARRKMIERLGYIEVFFREKNVLTAAGKAVVVIRDQRGPRGMGSKPDRRRWYAEPGPVKRLRKLVEAGVPDARLARLVAGPLADVERELVVSALAGPRDPEPAAPPVPGSTVACATSTIRSWGTAPRRVRCNIGPRSRGGQQAP